MAKIDTLRKRLKKAEATYQALSAQYAADLKELQSICKHPLIAERLYESYEYFNASPPRRICEICGTEEDGWGSGYKILRCDRVRDVSRDNFYQYRHNLLRQVACDPIKA